MGNPSDAKLTSCVRHNLGDWYSSSAVGARLRQQLIDELDEQLERLFGYHTVFLGVMPDLPVESLARSQASIVASPIQTDSSAGPMVVCEDEWLPFDTESVDTVVVFHGLEVASDPRQVLREIQRILVPNGNLIIAGFNPETVFGLGWYLRRFVSPRRWRDLRLERVPKLIDWLTLLNFKCDKPQHKLVLRPFGKGRLFRWMATIDDWLIDHRVPLGGAFVLHAKKQVTAGVSSVQRRQRRARLVPLPVSRPAVGAEPHRNQGTTSLNEES